MMKRFAFEERDMARVLLLVSREQAMPLPAAAARGDRVPERAFVCKTCDRVFPSFQALGGHRASHKKPRLDGDGDLKPKLHGCSICGLEFAVGQALGGHMRRHRAMVAGGGGVVTVPPATTGNKPVVSSNAVVGSGGIKRGLWLDLNHPPCDDGNGMDAVTASAATTPPPPGTRSTSSWIPAPWRWTASATSSSPSLAAGFFAGQ